MKCTNPADNLFQAIQQLLDSYGDGWIVGHVVLALGLERVGPDGEIESSPWLWCPPHQPDWQTDGLLEAAIEMRCAPPDDVL